MKKIGWFELLIYACVFIAPLMVSSVSFAGDVVDVSTMNGKVMCGYQGWFTCEGDGAGRGWFHWGKRGEFKPGACTIDLWPDMSELDDDEKFPTEFKYKDGSAASVFSSFKEKNGGAPLSMDEGLWN